MVEDRRRPVEEPVHEEAKTGSGQSFRHVFTNDFNFVTQFWE